MRNKERISEFLNEIKKVWENNPDMRFGQLVSNLTGYIEGEGRNLDSSVSPELMDIMAEDAVKLDQKLWNAEINEWRNALEKFKRE